jgi:hypothetical protein
MMMTMAQRPSAVQPTSPPAHIGTLEDRKPLGARRDGTDGKECSDDTVRLDERQGLAKG